MPRGKIKAADRDTVRSIKTAMQGSVIRAIVELITNSDDSYKRLEGDNEPHKGIIEVLYKKEGYRGLFAVRDSAAGMSREDVEEGFETYGELTSGMKAGKSVRGYFGHGAKDALAGMLNGRFYTFKDNQFVMCKLFIEKGAVWYDYTEPMPATPKIRSEHKVDGNGTIAYFEADPSKDIKVPRFETVHEELANNYLLRKIMLNPKRKVLLINEDDGKTRPLNYRMPEGKEILPEKFSIPYDNETFPIHVSIWRAEKGDLTQDGDDRMGGLLLVDEEDAVLGISLFKYDNEPLAARFFGQVTIGKFRKLLKKEEPVLSEARDGLVTRHPFCKVLIPEIEKRIDKEIKEEKLRRQREDQSKIDREETRRYKNAFNILNEIAEIEAQPVINLGGKLTDQLEEPPDGFCLYPSSAQITVGKRYVFHLHLNTNVVRHGSIVNVSCTNPKIRVTPSEIRVESENGTGVLRKYITIEGTEPNIEGTLRATTGNKLCRAKIYVVPEKVLLLSEGMVFQPESLTLRPNKSRKIYLLVYIKMIEGGSTIKISSDNDSIHISKQQIIVNEADAIRHVARYDLEIWGEGVGQKAMITAECESYMALLEATVKTKEQEKEKGRKGMFSKPDFIYDPVPPQRTNYSSETGKVIIYANFPSVQHYLGSDCRYRKTLPAQVLVADLVAERCFYEIAKKKVEYSGLTFSPAAKPARIERDALDLSRRFGKKVHEALVDQKLVNDSRNNFEKS